MVSLAFFLCLFNSLQVGYKPNTGFGEFTGLNRRFNSLQVGYKHNQHKRSNLYLLCFNSLQVGYKLHRCRLKVRLKAVSIPYRLATNVAVSEGALSVLMVSIPYRLATNFCRSFQIERRKKRFQFLIGWLQTHIENHQRNQGEHVSIPYRLATNSKRRTTSVDYLVVVSIPYRLATNPFRIPQHLHTLSVSIPYRLATNRYCISTCRARSFRFQFLIGWLQTFCRYLEYLHHLLHRFNSLQVGYKPGAVLSYQAHISQFQFLIGWLQTYLLRLLLSRRLCFNSLQVGYKPAPDPDGDGLPEFQFLIGWLQTVPVCHFSYMYGIRFNSLQVGYKPHFLCGHIHIPLVSIPYRLATNSHAVLSIFCLIRKFQFLIGWLQTRNIYAYLLHQACFNSLQVGYKLDRFDTINEKSGRKTPGFNSLQVGYKQSIEKPTLPTSFLFQFLIGWLQTAPLQTHAQALLGFNSLQVGYKLSRLLHKGNQICFVSIPYRLATNNIMRNSERNRLSCFNSLQVGYKPIFHLPK